MIHRPRRLDPHEPLHPLPREPTPPDRLVQATAVGIVSALLIGIPAALDVLEATLVPPWPGVIGGLLALTGVSMAVAVPLAMVRSRRRTRALGRMDAADVRLDHRLRVALPDGPMSTTPPDDPAWRAVRRTLVRLRTRSGMALVGDPPHLECAADDAPYRAEILAPFVADARAAAAWLAGFDDPVGAWLIAFALDDDTAPLRAGAALRRLERRAPDDPLTGRVLERAVTEGGSARRLACACAVGDRMAARAVGLDAGAVRHFAGIDLARLIDVVWRDAPSGERDDALDSLVDHPEPAVRLALCIERGPDLPHRAVVALAADGSRVVRGAAWSLAAHRPRAVRLDAARNIVRTRGDDSAHHPYLVRWRSAADADDPRKVPRHLRGPLSRLVPRALDALSDEGERADLAVAALRIDDPLYSRAARVAVHRLRRRFPAETGGGHLALSAPDRPDGHLSPTAIDHGHLSPPESSG